MNINDKHYFSNDTSIRLISKVKSNKHLTVILELIAISLPDGKGA